MNDRIDLELRAEDWPEIPAVWGHDPVAQVRALRDEVLRQLEQPTAGTHEFMEAARRAFDRLSQDCNPPERAHALWEMARFHYLDSRADLAVEVAREAVRVAVLSGDPIVESRARQNYATFLRDNGELFTSLREFERSLELCRAANDPRREGRILNNLGNWYSDAGLFPEARDLFERIAAYFASIGDVLSEQMALDNAAAASLRLGETARGLALSERAAERWVGAVVTADDYLWLVQGILTYCELLIQADRAEEALASARLAQAASGRSGVKQTETLAALAVAIASHACGARDVEDLTQVIEWCRDESTMTYLTALEAAARLFERLGQFDRALAVQHELLAFNRRRRFEEVRRALGCPSPEESEGIARLARLETEVGRKSSELIRIAVHQALRAGSDHARPFRVSRLAERFALAIGLADDVVGEIAFAAKLIDIGMMVIPDDLIGKPRELTAGERRIVERHAEFSADLLADARLAMLQPCMPIVRFHHERWDGTGPCSIAGGAIPVEARLIALCDAFEALTHDRPWRKACTRAEALQLIRRQAGAQFDPQLAQRFVDWIGQQYDRHEDFDALLAAEEVENDYVRMRERLERLMRSDG